MNAPTCPTCSEVIPPVLIGRPRIYCSDVCRYEMRRLRRELVAAEEELAQARYTARVQYGQWADRAQRAIPGLEREVELARARVPEAMR